MMIIPETCHAKLDIYILILMKTVFVY